MRFMRLMMMAGIAASAYAGYRAVSARKEPPNRAGLPEADLATAPQQPAEEAERTGEAMQQPSSQY